MKNAKLKNYLFIHHLFFNGIIIIVVHIIFCRDSNIPATVFIIKNAKKYFNNEIFVQTKMEILSSLMM